MQRTTERDGKKKSKNETGPENNELSDGQELSHHGKGTNWKGWKFNSSPSEGWWGHGRVVGICRDAEVWLSLLNLTQIFGHGKHPSDLWQLWFSSHNFQPFFFICGGRNPLGICRWLWFNAAKSLYQSQPLWALGTPCAMMKPHLWPSGESVKGGWAGRWFLSQAGLYCFIILTPMGCTICGVHWTSHLPQTEWPHADEGVEKSSMRTLSHG